MGAVALNRTRDRERVGERRLRISYEEYLHTFGENGIVEWVDGEAIVHMPPRVSHQSIVGLLYQLLSMFVALFDLGVVHVAPFEVKLWPNGPSREPDIFFVNKDHLDRLTEERLNGPPDLVVEVVSPESVLRDRDEKFREYEKAGVREYWIVDSRPGQHRADFYVLEPDGRFRLTATEEVDRYTSAVVDGFWFRPAWLWEHPLPHPLHLLREIVGVEKLIEILKEGSGR